MRLPTLRLTSLLAALTLCMSTAAENVIVSDSLNSCQSGSNFTATYFDVSFTPSNRSVNIDIVGVSSITGNVTAQLEVVAYGFTILNQTLNPCELGLEGMCPLSSGQINIVTNYILSEDDAKKVPGIAYSVPDLDGVVRVQVYSADTGISIACMEADLSNTKTVYQKAVGWATAIIAGLGLVASGVTSGMGHTNTAAHVAANALSLFGFFQAQAVIGMTSVTMPPIVQAWTQNFQWSMGVIRIGFLQSICTWYQRATGGTPTTYLSTLTTVSVQVQRRSLDIVSGLIPRGVKHLATRATATNSFVTRTTSATTSTSSQVIVRGIDRVGFRAGIEQTNIFMTGLIFFIFILFNVSILVALFKVFCELAVKSNWMKSDKFLEFRNGWKIVLKGIVFRLVLLGYVQMCVLCLWELVERDSVAEVILALVVFISMSAALFWAAIKVIRLAKRSMMMHKNPAYILYSDLTHLNKWGFLYVQYKATAYWFVLPVLGYIVCKAIFVAFAQNSPIAQAIGLVIVEAVALIGVCVLRPWMDKKTNIFNISIAVVNFINALFLLVFSNAFGQPEMVSGIMGVLFALYNVIFAVILLVMVLVASIYAIVSKNPETRYQPMRDDRGSFIKSQAALTTELDALGAIARGDGKTPYGGHKDMDDVSFSTDSLTREPQSANSPIPSGTRNSPTYRNREPVSPVENAPMYPSDHAGRRGPPALTTEPGATARGEGKTPYGGHQDMDAESFSTDSLNRELHNANLPIPSGTGNSSTYRNREPVGPVVNAPMYPSDHAGRRGPPAPRQEQQQPRGPYDAYGSGNRENDYYANGQRQPSVSPNPYQRTGSSHSNYQNNDYARQPQFGQQNNGSPWQRGAGYEH